jgi:phage protein D
MRPAFRIAADGADVTGRIEDRLLALRLTDAEGEKSDTLRLELDDRDARLELPESGARLDVSLGFAPGALTPMGSYVVDGLSGAGPATTVTVEATAADMASAVRDPRTRAWIDVSLGDIAREAAGRAGLQPAVSDRMARIRYAYVAQTAESDLHLLTRLAREAGGTAKAAGGRLIVVARGEALAGQAPVILLRARLSDWRWYRGERGRYAAVEAEWQDVLGGEQRLVRVGEGSPVRRLRHPFATEDEARRACRAQLDAAARGELGLTATVAGFEPRLFAGGLVRLPDLRPGLPVEWTVTSVDHELGRGLVTSFAAETAREEGT